MNVLVSVLSAIAVIAFAGDASACCKPAPRETRLTPLVILSPVAGLELESLDVDISVSGQSRADYLVEQVILNTTDKDIETKAAAFWCQPFIDQFDCDHFRALVYVDGRSTETVQLDVSAEGNELSANSVWLNGVFNLRILARGRVTLVFRGRTPLTYYGNCGGRTCPRISFWPTGWPLSDPKYKPFETFGRHRVRFTWLEDLERDYQIEPSPQPTVSGPGFAEWGCVNCKAAPSYSLGLVSRPKQSPHAKPKRHK